jgi:hypothetical protein
LLISAYKAKGKLFAFSHLRDRSLWRRTDKQLDWVMYPGDRNQIEDKTVDAIMGLLETKKQEDRNATVELSAADVVDQSVHVSPGGVAPSFATTPSGIVRFNALLIRSERQKHVYTTLVLKAELALLNDDLEPDKKKIKDAKNAKINL